MSIPIRDGVTRNGQHVADQLTSEPLLDLETGQVGEDELRSYLRSANIPSLLMVLFQLTGNERWITAPFRPAQQVRGTASADDDTGGLAPELQDEVREAAVAAIRAWHAGAPVAVPAPTGSLLVRLMSTCTGEPVPDQYAPMIAAQLRFDPVPVARPADPASTAGFHTIVIGAGISGLVMSFRLQRAGVPFTVLERGHDVGGVWRDNRYPGAGVDTANEMYSFSFFPHNWSMHYSKRDEMLAYFSAFADEFGLRPSIRFGTEVLGLDYDEAAQLWHVRCRTADGAEETLTANVVVSAMGIFAEPKRPDIDGLDSAVVEHAGDVALFAEPEVAAGHGDWFRARGGRAVVGLDDSYDELLADQPAGGFDYPELDEREPAAMAYSSATTGRPKGVLYSHRALYLHTLMVCLRDTWAIGEADTVLPVVPMFHVNAWGLPFASIWMGARLVLPGVRPTAEDLLPLLDGVTFAAAVPTVWMDVFARMEERGIRLPSLRTVVSGGAPLPAALLRQADRLGVPLVHSYGMTEASPLVLVGAVRSDLAATEDRRLKQGFVVPGLDYEIRATDGTGGTGGTGGEERGELCLRGPWIVDGYEDDERSAGAFSGGWYRSGDIVTRDAEGYLHVVDRMADLVKSGGEWISTLELEDALSTYPGVTAAAVVGVPDPRWQERPRAYLVTSGPVDLAAVRAALAARFPRFWIPDEFVLTDSLPLTSVGKYDKKRLRAEALSTPGPDPTGPAG